MLKADRLSESISPLVRGLACAAITPGLRTVLLLDAPYAGFKACGAILAQLLEYATGLKVKQAKLGAWGHDDDLWGSVALRYDESGKPLQWHTGALAELSKDLQKTDPCLTLVLIPDLSRLNLAAMRAFIMLGGADVSHLERHGQHETWQPTVCWLASCLRTEAGTLSPHLLDRFALRLTWQALSQAKTISDVIQQVNDPDMQAEITSLHLPGNLKDILQLAGHNQPKFTSEGIEQVLHHTSLLEQQLPRREIALARLAKALAQLKGMALVEKTQVNEAVALIGLLPSSQEREEDLALDPTKQVPGDQEFQIEETNQIEEDLSLGQPQPDLHDGEVPVYEPNQIDTLSPTALIADPYPEDKALVEREVASLQLPLIRRSGSGSGHGAIIGVERTKVLNDISVMATLSAAAPYQTIRRKFLDKESPHLLISPADLRSYRREPVREQMLVLLLDYTCMKGCEWQQALLPYLRWAYVERASICLVQVGAADASNELCAEVIYERSILVPNIGEALTAQAGKATPLAHGLDLALSKIRHALEHGRSRIKQAALVILSDGRGNVSLEASRKRALTHPVRREGIEDAIQIAQHIRNLKHVQAVLLNPQPKYYPNLPLALAQALGASLVNIQHSEVGES